jgi:hypothetical protein
MKDQGSLKPDLLLLTFTTLQDEVDGYHSAKWHIAKMPKRLAINV